MKGLSHVAQKFTQFLWTETFTDKDTEPRAHMLQEVYLSLAGRRPSRVGRYLDVGCGNGVVSAYLGEGSERIYGIDIKPAGWLTSQGYNATRPSRPLERLVGVAGTLPFVSESFDFVSLISMLEYPHAQQRAIGEAIRVLRPGGAVFIQVTNRHFLVQMDSGLPNPFFLPRVMREPLLRLLGYGWLNDYDPPSKRGLECLFADHRRPDDNLVIRSLIWPAVLAPGRLRWAYALLRRLGLLRVFPPAYVALYEKPQ